MSGQMRDWANSLGIREMSVIVSGHMRVPKPKKGKEYSDFGKNRRVCGSRLLSGSLCRYGNPQ